MYRPLAWAAALTLSLSAFSACGGGTTPATAPTPLPALVGFGVAYVPDGGGGGAPGVRVVHFEDANGNLLPASQATAVPIAFTGSVSAFRVTTDNLIAAALVSTGAGAPYPLIQDVSGTGVGSLNPVGAAYDLAAPAPTSAPSATIPDAGDVEVLGIGSQAIAIAVGGSNGLVATTSISAPPLTFGGYAPFPTAIPAAARQNIAVSSAQGDGSYHVLVRGPSDLLSYNVTLVSTGYQFSYGAENTTLGTSTALRGRGAMAFDAQDDSRALVAVPGTTQVQLISGLAGQITLGSTLTLPTAVRSIASSPNGAYAAVGADGGVYVLAGFGGGLSIVRTVTPTYTGSDGQPHTLANVASVGFTPDGRYLVALAMLSAASTIGTVVVVPFSQSTGVTVTPTASPASATAPPAQFTQSGLTTGGPQPRLAHRSLTEGSRVPKTDRAGSGTPSASPMVRSIITPSRRPTTPVRRRSSRSLSCAARSSERC